MDTRQLAAFCEVVERRSFSEAAARLGVTQPAVSQQVRALEQRLGTQLLDRSGRRVEPTEAGLRLYRGAQRMLALEEQLLEELARARGAAARDARDRRVDRARRRSSLPLLLCEFQRDNPELRVELSVSDTQSVVELVADRRLELGIVGAARRHRSVAFEPFFRDEVILVCPPRASVRRARRSTLDELADGPLILMQQGAGVRQMVEDELRKSGRKAPRPRGAARARPPGVGAQRRAGGLRRLASSRGARSRAELAAGHARRGARSTGSTSRARSGSRAPPAARAARAAQAFVAFAREQLDA